VMAHCENDSIVESTRARFVAEGKVDWRYHGAMRPAIAEIEAVGRLILLARLTGCMLYPVHLSAGPSAKLVAQARRDGLPVVGETCPQFLVADDSEYESGRAVRYIHTPPLRSRDDQSSLWEELGRSGLQTVCSDHSGYTLSQRTDYADVTQVAPGIPGTETVLPLMFTHGVAAGRLELEDLVRICSANPARTFGMHPRKGTIAPGSDADVVIYDPGPTRVLRDDDLNSAAGYSPYTGMEIRGRVALTVLRGRVAYDGQDVLAASGSGRFIARSPVDPADLP
jgi:dihydropyrimidinase